MRQVTSRKRFRGPMCGTLALAALFAGGCRLSVAMDSVLGVPGTLLSNVGGWNLSACGGNGFQTCAELLVDNQQQIFGGRTAGELVYDTAVSFLTATGSAKADTGHSPG